MGTFFETQCIYQTVQYFIRSKTGVLYVTVFKHSLRNFSVTTLRWAVGKVTNLSQGGPKNGMDMIYPHAKFGGDLPPHGGERGKMGVFCLFFLFFLFVTLTVCVSLGYRRTHYEGYIVAIYRSILMQFSACLEEETSCRIIQKHLNYITRWRHICIRIRSKFGNFSKFGRQSLCARLRPFRRKIETIPPQPISPWIVDVYLYKNF